MSTVVLRAHITPEDDSWEFQYPANALPSRTRPGKIYGRLLSISASTGITLRIEEFSSNRVLNSDDPSKFILFTMNMFRFPEQPPKVAVDYVLKMFRKGVVLNGVQFRFYHHSNSQLRGRSCFLREATSDEELDRRIYPMGDFGRIMNVAKRAKRIGLLFSSAEIDFNLDPNRIADIPDIKMGDEIFSDGCGLMSRRLAVQVSKAKRIIFRGTRYTPTVFQIRYLGYKGVLMLHPEMDSTSPVHLAQFRKSMKKFVTTADTSFSVVGYSKPYSFGRLNNDIIVLLSSLDVSNEALINKQQAYFDWVASASENVTNAIDFLSCLDMYPLAEQVLLRGLDDPDITKQIRKLQSSEISKTQDERTQRFKSRMMIHKSRRLYGVCDPFQVLKEGEVHIRITASRKGPSTPIHGDVFIVRNPCLHPGDILKLRAVSHPKLNHLVDCLVFATIAKPNHKAAPSMSSGGDLDGDEFFVCWDPDIMPRKISESYDYPGNKEFVKRDITRMDLAQHFVSYTSSGVAKVSALHAKWARSSPQGALCKECQELNALHSQSVDGANIRIPERLATPPEQSEPYILDLLEENAQKFSESFLSTAEGRREISTVAPEDGEILLRSLLQSKQNAVSEYELFNLALRFCRQNSIDIRPYFSQIDFSALTTSEKHTIQATLQLSSIEYPEIWNSLVRSDILKPRDIYQRNLARPFAIHRLYSSEEHGLKTFFEYLRLATQDYTRKLLIIQTDSRFSVGIFMRGDIPWDEDPEVNENVVTCTFMPKAASTISTLRPCHPGYRLHCSDNRFQLYDKHLGNTFVFINRPPSALGNEITTSIALVKFPGGIQTQLGRVNRTPVRTIELHVVSNRDRVAHQLFDLWFEHIPTEERVRRFERKPTPYHLNDIAEVKWGQLPEEDQWLEDIFYLPSPMAFLRSPNGPNNEDFPDLGNGENSKGARPKHTKESFEALLSTKDDIDIDKVMSFAMKHHAHTEVVWTFEFLAHSTPMSPDVLAAWIERVPSLVYNLLQIYPPGEDLALTEELQPVTQPIIRNIIRSANETKIATLVALEKLAKSIGELTLEQFVDLLMLSALSVRSPQLCQEVLLVLSDSYHDHCPPSSSAEYGRKQALGVAFDRAEEAADECPCDEDGRPRKRQSVAPSHAKLSFTPDYPSTSQIKAEIRIDARNAIRIHSHVRLQAASRADNRWINAPIMDGLVVQASKGELKLQLLHPAPPEMEEMDWNMYDAGSTATSNAMMDAIKRLLTETNECCAFYDLIVNDAPVLGLNNRETIGSQVDPEDLNESQLRAMRSWRSPLSLIWGPPGTGKTTVMVQILFDIIKSYGTDLPKILMTASTHNANTSATTAVDNVLERFIRVNQTENLLAEEQILRVATDQSKVSVNLQHYTINARVGGDMTENNRLLKQAQDRVEKAKLVFTTCAGAGLGILRKVDFSIALIDEASQITEPCALIPLVKGVERAVVVGDHVQLRPTVRHMAKALEYDVSLLERLYTKTSDEEAELLGMSKTMLDVQYRSPRELNEFPSREFYQDRLQTSERNATVANFLAVAEFPWPLSDDGNIIPAVFIQCSAEEDMGGRSKSNEGQVELIHKICPLLTRVKAGGEEEDRISQLTTTVLSPYTKQIQSLRHKLPGSITCSTVDSFQGRESDIIIFSTVRCNADADVGFLEDPRRLNVMWTRARLALIIVGDRATLSANPLWKRALEACEEVVLNLEE
ncbi:RNA-directed RNA polymerase [Panaeolus papilionaceus]|nr:RNA-directed RNA polymerase [Panaeolus papilionaceus]